MSLIFQEEFFLFEPEIEPKTSVQSQYTIYIQVPEQLKKVSLQVLYENLSLWSATWCHLVYKNQIICNYFLY